MTNERIPDDVLAVIREIKKKKTEPYQNEPCAQCGKILTGRKWVSFLHPEKAVCDECHSKPKEQKPDPLEELARKTALATAGILGAAAVADTVPIILSALHEAVREKQDQPFSPVFITNLFRELVTREIDEDSGFAFACSTSAQRYLNAVFAAIDNLSSYRDSIDLSAPNSVAEHLNLSSILAPVEAEIRRAKNESENE